MGAQAGARGALRVSGQAARAHPGLHCAGAAPIDARPAGGAPGPPAGACSRLRSARQVAAPPCAWPCGERGGQGLRGVTGALRGLSGQPVPPGGAGEAGGSGGGGVCGGGGGGGSNGGGGGGAAAGGGPRPTRSHRRCAAAIAAASSGVPACA